MVGFCGKTWRKRGESDDQESFSPYHFSADNPIRFSDPDGRTPIIPLLIAAYEIGSSIYDAYQAYKTVNDPNASKAEKAVAVAGAMSGLILPGGGYGTAGKATLGAVKTADKAVDAAKAADKVADATKVSRNGALKEAKKDAGVPRTQHPEKAADGKQYEKINMTDRNGNNILGKDGKPVTTREYTYTNKDGKKIIIQDHKAGHQYSGGTGNQGAHLNVRPQGETRTGKVPGTKEHYNFN